MEINLYSKPQGCMQCQFTKRFLNENGLNFTEIDITQNDERLNYFKDLGYTQVPIVEVDGSVWTTGFAIDDLNELVTHATTQQT